MAHPLAPVFENLSRHHREHEKFYAREPLRDAAELQRTSLALKALAERWQTARATAEPSPSPFAGAPDLNDPRAIELAGILFMESGEPPAEIEAIKRDLQTQSEGAAATGEWLAQAMEASWGVAETLLQIPELTDLLGERHAIIANDWQNATDLQLIARLLRRAHAVLDAIDFTTAALRADLAGPRRSAALLFAAAELIDQAADLTVHSAVVVHRNEPLWRRFHARVAALAATPSP